MNKLVKQEAFIDSVKAKSAELKNKFVLKVFTPFHFRGAEKDYKFFNVVSRVVREFEMAQI